jgi:hypothetical protein
MIRHREKQAAIVAEVVRSVALHTSNLFILLFFLD